MVKKMLFAVVPMMLLASVSMAQDDLLLGLDTADIQVADIAIEEANLDVDFDSLADNADGDEAIEACFRRFGYGGFGCFRPWFGYRFHCYRPFFHHYHFPIYGHYWGCW